MKLKLLLISFLLIALSCNASDNLNGTEKRHVVLSGSNIPDTHIIDLVEPVAMYTISTSILDFTFDANYYSEYTIHLVGEYVEMDYFVYTPVVYIPVATFGEIVDIYIESEDCGCYYGTLDQSAYTNTY